MSIKLGAAVFGGILVLVAAQGCVFGGDDDAGGNGAVAGPGAIVTATLPATLTDPILLGQAQTTGGTTGGTQPAGSSGQTYVVKSGDTLGSIATSVGVPPDQQAAWTAEVLRLNNIADARLLAVGVELDLPRIATPSGTPAAAGTPGTPAATPNVTATPAAAATTPAATSTPTVAPTTTGQSSGETYTVVSGDTPLVIAQKLGVPEAQRAAWANELVALNGISASSLQIGDVLDLPAGTP